MGFLLTDAYMRNYTGALDASSVHSTLSALRTYMYSDATCYAGQIVAVVEDSEIASNGLYLITSNSRYDSGVAKSVDNSPFTAVQYSSAAAVDTAIANMAGVLKFMGVLPTGTKLNATKFKKGYAWLVTADSGGSTLYGIFDTAKVTLESGDLVICINGDTEKAFSTLTAADLPTYFVVINKNIDRSITSTATTSTDAELVQFDGTDGKKVKGAGQTLASLKSECKNLANATGTLSVAHGGTGQTTTAGVKTAFGIDTLETDVANIKNGSTAAGKADKLTNSRSLAYNHPTLGALSEYSGNSFDGSSNMAALAIDGVYTGANIPTTISTKFSNWAYTGTNVSLPTSAQAYVRALQVVSGSSCYTIRKQLERFLKVYIDGTQPVALMKVGDDRFIGEAVLNNRKCLVSIYEDDGIIYLFITDLVNDSYTESNFKNMMVAVETYVADLSKLFPVGTEFVNTSNGTTYIYKGYTSNRNQFVANTWQ